jgi:putative NADH-flavin reductase
MNVALIGPTGTVGSRLLAELLRRGHEVTGIARHPEGLPSQPRLTVKRGDANDDHPQLEAHRPGEERAPDALVEGHDDQDQAAVSTCISRR